MGNLWAHTGAIRCIGLIYSTLCPIGELHADPVDSQQQLECISLPIGRRLPVLARLVFRRFDVRIVYAHLEPEAGSTKHVSKFVGDKNRSVLTWKCLGNTCGRRLIFRQSACSSAVQSELDYQLV